jgi:hypothetical protein
MGMESIEDRCLTYLSQTSNTLVPFGSLLGYVRRDEASEAITGQDLLSFLKYHELIHVVDAPQTGGEIGGAPSETALEPFVILKSRIPNQRDMAMGLREQLDQMRTTLQAALDEARQAGDLTRVTGLELALNRAEELDERFSRLFRQ